MDWLRSNWRWLALVVVLIVVTNTRAIPWQVVVAVLAAAAGYLFREGWRVWQRSGGPPARAKVTYWRGQRIEVGPKRSGPALPDARRIGPALIYFIVGGALALGALAVVLQRFGF